MKRKNSSIWKVTLALVLACSLAMTFAIPTGATESSLVVTIESPEPGEQFEVSDTFNVVATVHNSGDETANNVDAVISWVPPEDAELVGGDSDTKDLGDISPGSTQDAQWTLHCTGPSHPLTITVAADGAFDSVNVQQLGEPGIQIVIDSPLDEPEPMKVGVGQQFDVTATVTNTGLEPLCNVNAGLDLSAARATVVTYPSVPCTLDKDEYVTLTWTLECDDADEVTSKPDENDPKTWVVDYSKIVAWANGYGCSTGGYVDDDDDTSVYQKYLIVEITAPADGKHYTECQEFVVDATFYNYHSEALTDVTAWIVIDPSGPGVGAIVQPPPATQVQLPNIQPRSYVELEIPWHLHCESDDDVTITVYGRGITASTALTIANWDEIYVYQDEAAALVADITDPCEPVCYGVSNNFPISADITNTSSETSLNTTATITWSPQGDVELLSPSATVNIGTLAGGATQPVTWDFHCTDPGAVDFTVTPAGTHANNGLPITDITSDTERVYQMPLLVTITSPNGGETYSECQTFSVEADLCNPGGLGNLGPVDATIILNGPADLVNGESATKTITSVNAGDTQHVAWTVHCDGSGDVTIIVEASTVWDMTGQEQYTRSEPVTVHQEYATDLEVTILSPPCFMEPGAAQTFIATSQDFAVTALVENLGEADSLNTTVTVSSNNASVVPTPEATIYLGTLAGYSSKTVTWTLHCDGSGFTWIDVSASGTDENSNDRKRDCACTAVFQYPAAHLEVDITGVVPVGEYEPSYIFPVCTEFDVYYTVTNTGEADASEVMATLSASPDGSVRPVAGEDSGYTQEIGTLTGHRQDGTYEGVWRLHCKEACESTITITASGRDEYGLSVTQMSKLVNGYYNIGIGFGSYVVANINSTPALVTVDGSVNGTVSGTGTVDGTVSGSLSGTGTIDGSVDGTLSGSGTIDGSVSGSLSGSVDAKLTGHVDGTLSGEFRGTINEIPYCGTLSGGIEADLDGTFTGTASATFTGTLCGKATIDGTVSGTFSGTATFNGTVTGEFHGTATFNGTVTGEFHGTATFDGTFSGTLHGEYAINGQVQAWIQGCAEASVYLDGYTYEIVTTQNPGAPIPEDFVEPDEVTVKQVETPTEADLDITKVANGDTFTVGTEVTFTVTIENLGEVDATGVRVTDLLPAGLGYVSSAPDQGWYDVTSGIWHIGDLAVGYSVELDITATVSVEGYISNIADITACDQPDSTTTNNSAMVMITGEAAPPPEPYEEWTITLDEGYNLISLPLIPDNPDITAMMTGIDFIKVSQYVNDGDPTPDDWFAYNPPPAPSDLSTMEDGWGYWINMNTAGPPHLTFSGQELVADPMSLPPSYPVLEGWNLIGFKSTTPKLASDYLAGIAGKYVMIYGYDGSFFIVGTPGHEYLEPGLGYWLAVKTGESGTIFP